MQPQHVVPDPAPDRITARLEALGPGVSWGLLKESLEKGQLRRDTTTLNHPRITPEYNRWQEMVRSVREGLRPHGWTPSDIDNIPSIWSPGGSTAIWLRAGNVHTGTGRIPKTKRPIGRAGRRLLRTDRSQGDLFIPPLLLQGMYPDVYLFLYHHDINERYDRNVLRSELSLVGNVDRKGRIMSWRDRVLLPVLDLVPSIETRREDEHESEFDVQIRRKKGS